ncbi:MAG: antitoxin MazE5 [Acidimicrobiales bacterium]
MARVRVSTTVDEGLLERARGLRASQPDSVLLDQALAALVANHRTMEIDQTYGAYDRQPLDTADAWGDLESFRSASS